MQEAEGAPQGALRAPLPVGLAVEYVVDAYSTQSFYSWDIAASNENLGPLQYKQPTDCGA